MARFLKITILTLCLLATGSAWAGGTLSERTYKRLTVIHQLIADSKYDEALERLDSLAPKVKNKAYEYATVMQTYGFAYAAKDKTSKAIEAFTEALKQDALPDGVQLGMRYNIAQLYAVIPNYPAAAKAYEDWFKKAESPTADTFVFAATVYAQLNQYEKAIEKINIAISMSDKPKESWYQLLVAMYFERKQYSKAAKVLETLVALKPEDKKYWKQLSNVYFTLRNNNKALSVMELANKRGLLTEEKELMNLVNMYLYQSSPYKAAKLLESEIKKGRIRATGDNLYKLAEAWMRAQESDEAIAYMLKAADAQDSGKLYLKTAQLYLEKEDWNNVLQTTEKALGMKNLDKVGTTHLIRGMAFYELGRYKNALAEFKQSSRFPETKKQAIQWLAHIKAEH
jgi:tetratricopeptide (TPR) repeat protein